MTYAQLYSLATTWTARHIAQDAMLAFGREAEVASYDLQQVSDWQKMEGGERIPVPMALPTDGPEPFVAYDPQIYGPCRDPQCTCHGSKFNLRAYGPTASEALAGFWDAWGDA